MAPKRVPRYDQHNYLWYYTCTFHYKPVYFKYQNMNICIIQLKKYFPRIFVFRYYVTKGKMTFVTIVRGKKATIDE